MSDEKLSPAPWRADDKCVRDARGNIVCLPPHTIGERIGDYRVEAWRVDAALIADAPAMLVLLARIGRDLDLIGSHGEHLKSILAMIDKHGWST